MKEFPPGNSYSRIRVLLVVLLIALVFCGGAIYWRISTNESGEEEGSIQIGSGFSPQTSPAEAANDWEALGLNIYPFTITEEYVEDIKLLAAVFGQKAAFSRDIDLHVENANHPLARYGTVEYRTGLKKAASIGPIAPAPPGITIDGVVESDKDASVLLFGEDASGVRITIKEGSSLGQGWKASKVTRAALWAVFEEDPEILCSFDVAECLHASLSREKLKDEEKEEEKDKRKREEEERREVVAKDEQSGKTDRKFTPGEVRSIWDSL
jgi:hypothetical protein